MEYCKQFTCSECCKKAVVPLLNEDINRIIMHGYYDAYFTVEKNGIKTIRTFKSGKCVFLDDKSGYCKIYNSRPEFCTLRPITVSEKNKEPIVDDVCKHSKNFEIQTEDAAKMAKFFATLEREIKWRRKTGYY